MAVHRGWGERGSGDMAPGGSPLGGRGPVGSPLGDRGWGHGGTLADRRVRAGKGAAGKEPQGREAEHRGAWVAGAPPDIQGWGEDSCPQTPKNSFHGTWPRVRRSAPRAGKQETAEQLACATVSGPSPAQLHLLLGTQGEEREDRDLCHGLCGAPEPGPGEARGNLTGPALWGLPRALGRL